MHGLLTSIRIAGTVHLETLISAHIEKFVKELVQIGDQYINLTIIGELVNDPRVPIEKRDPQVRKFLILL